MTNKSGIYLITCTSNKSKYVGSAVNLSRRFKEHIYDLLKNNHHNKHLQNAWNKYGEGCFVFSVLEVVSDRETIYDREQFWIETIKPEFNMSKVSYNSRLGMKDTEETNSRKSLSKSRQWASLSDEQREVFRSKVKAGVKEFWKSLSKTEKKERIKSMSRPHSEEIRKKISEKVNKAYSEGRIPGHRKLHSEETKAKIREARARQSEKQLVVSAKKRSEWELGREQRELDRREKLRIANTGKKQSKETKDKLRKIALEQNADPEYKQKHHEALLEVMGSSEMRERLSKAHKGKKLSKAHKQKIGKAHLGMKRSPEAKANLSKARKLWWSKRKKK